MVRKPVIPLQIGTMPFLKVLLTYLVGIVIAQLIPWTYALVIGIMSVCVSFFGLFLLALFYRLPIQLLNLLLYLCWLSLGVMQYGRTLPQTRQNYLADQRFSQLIGDIVEEPLYKESSIRIRVNLSAGIDSMGVTHAVSGKLLLTIYRDSAINLLLHYGDVIQFSSNVQRVAPPYNPHEFDYRRYLYHRGIHHQQRLPATQIVVLRSHTSWYTYLLILKDAVVTRFRENISDQTAFSVAAALVFGYRAEMDPEIYTAFTNTGTIHILSVSGMHVSMVFVLLTFLLRPLDRWTFGKSFRFSIVLIFIWLYVMLTGMAPPILRAGIMISFFVFSQWIGRRQQGLNALFASGFCILWYDPSLLFDVGFQLSYLAMLGIFLIFPLLRSLYLPRKRWLRTLVDYSYISIAAQLVTTPFTLYYFGQFPNYFLLANLLITLPATVIMYLGVGLMLLPIPVLAPIMGALENSAVHIMVSTLQWIGNLPGATWQGISFTIPQVFLLFSAITALFIAINYRLKMALYALSIALFFLISTAIRQWYQQMHYRGLHIYQMRQHLAMAWYEPGHVLLFTSLDSLSHPSIQYAVLPDLTYYRDAHQIKMVQISTKENSLLTLGKSTLYVWNQGDYDPPPNVDIILIRNSRRFRSPQRLQSTMYVLDGSNSAYSITTNTAELRQRQADFYILKDNFAYVWKTD